MLRVAWTYDDLREVGRDDELAAIRHPYVVAVGLLLHRVPVAVGRLECGDLLAGDDPREVLELRTNAYVDIPPLIGRDWQREVEFRPDTKSTVDVRAALPRHAPT